MIVFDDVSFDRVASYPLGAQELACSLTSVTFAGDDTPYYALGTALVKPDEYEPSKGRLVLLAYRWAAGRSQTGSLVSAALLPAGCNCWQRAVSWLAAVWHSGSPGHSQITTANPACLLICTLHPTSPGAAASWRSSSPRR